MSITRRYQAHETPRVGDVIRLDDGPFGTAVVAAVSDRPCESPEYTLYRVHVQFKSEIPVVATEVLIVSGYSLRQFPLYLTPDNKIANRNY